VAFASVLEVVIEGSFCRYRSRMFGAESPNRSLKTSRFEGTVGRGIGFQPIFDIVRRAAHMGYSESIFLAIRSENEA
jgi:hypothetical protein